MKKRWMKMMIPALVSLSMTVSPFPVYAETFAAEPGRPYDDATAERLKDNVLEYDEIGMLIDTYNPTLKNLRVTYQDQKDSMEDFDALKRQMNNGVEQLWDVSAELGSQAAMLEGVIGLHPQVTPGTYAGLVYESVRLENQAEQLRLSVDQLQQVTPEMLRVKMLDSSRAALVSGAQSALIGYEQLLLQKENLKTTLELLEAVYRSAERQAASGFSTQNDVVSAKQNLESTQAAMLTLDANVVKLRQTLCTMMGWAYDAVPEIRAVPSADASRVDSMNLAVDTGRAVDNNFTLRYNLMNMDILDAASPEFQNLQRTVTAEKTEIASLMVNLYNSVLQANSELGTAKAALELEKIKMETADRKKELGIIGSLEYLQQKNAYQSAQTAVKQADLTFFRSMETYDWAVQGNLTLSQ